MKRKIILFVAAILLSVCTYAQDDAALTKAMLEQANEMGKKFIAKDYTGFLKYSHPAVIKVMGGVEKMTTATITELQAIEKEGVKFISIKFGVPSKIIRANNELQCTLPEAIEMRVPNGKLTTTTTMIAVSQDKGKNWYFIDTSGNNLGNMQLLLPTLSDDLYVPMPTDPIFEEDVKAEDIKTE